MDIVNIKPGLDGRVNQKPTRPDDKEIIDSESKAQKAQQPSSHAVETHLQQISKEQLNITILHRSLASGLSHISTKSLEPFKLKEPSEAITIATDIEEKNKSLFDFDEVAKNVLSFVEGALNSAAQQGASQDELNTMLGEARKGVAIGIKAARQDLGMTKDSKDPLSIGINKAHEKINQGLDDFYKRINEPEDTTNSIGLSTFAYEQQFGKENNANISIQTKDGDLIEISFASIQAYQDKFAEQQLLASDSEGNSFYVQQQESNQAYFQSDAFSYSVEGELDEGELTAIGELVEKISKVSDEFYNGDVQAAYQQALKLGFNSDEIGQFSMQLSSNTVQSTQTYQQVAAYEKSEKNIPDTIKQPLNNYVKELLSMVEQGKQQLAGQDDIDTVVSQVFSLRHQLEGNELIDVVSKFNHFNQELLKYGSNNGEI